jgi:hypothetical protein
VRGGERWGEEGGGEFLFLIRGSERETRSGNWRIKAMRRDGKLGDRQSKIDRPNEAG